MSARFVLALILSISICPAVRLLADDAPAVDNSKYQFEGKINSPVFVHSGPGDDYYPTQKLDTGATVTVVGIKFTWLKIVPPEGSFCYIAGSEVELSADGKTAKVVHNANVRAGSLLNTIKTTVQGQLFPGDTVEVIGKEDSYLKIKPPEKTYLYVKQDNVTPVRPMQASAQPQAPAPAANPNRTANPSDNQTVATATPPVAPATPSLTGNQKPAQPSIDSPAPEAPVATATPTTLPSTQPAQFAAAPSTKPVEISAEVKFGNYEDEFTQISKQPLVDQPIAQLVTKYQSIEKSEELSSTLKQVVTLRIATLKARGDSQAKLVEMQRWEKEQAEKQLALKAEQQELAEQLKRTDIELFTAVGELQTSSLQIGGGVLYRLIDPGTGRTLIYIRSDDKKFAAMIGQFIGVNGDQSTDSQTNLHFITPKEVQAVDINKVNNAIAAEIVPPSLMARTAGEKTASGN